MQGEIIRRQACKDIKQRLSRAAHAVVHGVDEEDEDDARRVGHHSLAKPTQVVPDPPFGHAEVRLSGMLKKPQSNARILADAVRGGPAACEAAACGASPWRGLRHQKMVETC